MARDHSISKSGSLSNENRSSQNRKHRQVLRKYIRTYIIPGMEEEKNIGESDDPLESQNGGTIMLKRSSSTELLPTNKSQI